MDGTNHIRVNSFGSVGSFRPPDDDGILPRNQASECLSVTADEGRKTETSEIEGSAPKARVSKYHIWYDQIMERARQRKPLGCYSERHHVVPRSLGGDDCDSNLVDLTYREHFLAHWLLTRMHCGAHRRRMQMALQAMVMALPRRTVSNWQTEIARKVTSFMEDDPEMWVVRSRNVVAERVAKRHRRVIKSRDRSKERDEFKLTLPALVSERGLRPEQLGAMASKLLALHKRVKIPTRHSSDKTEEENIILRQLRKQRKAASKSGVA